MIVAVLPLTECETKCDGIEQVPVLVCGKACANGRNGAEQQGFRILAPVDTQPFQPTTAAQGAQHPDFFYI